MAGLGLSPDIPPGKVASAPVVRIYDSNPAHLWNRLHAALFVRVADGKEYGGDRVDPLLWIGSKYLLEGSTHDAVIRLLDEFNRTHGERLIAEPLKRAMLQRDLWAVFDWLQGDHDNFERPLPDRETVRRAVARLGLPLSTAIGNLALSPAQIESLPDNYERAARAGLVPADLFEPGGPWVSVGRTDGPVAVRHAADLGVGKNSTFFVFINLPGGRDATVRYLERLRTFTGPFWVENRYPSPDVPQFPAGTRVALIRRALLVDSHGRIASTPITEQVQLRVYREIRKMTAQEFDAAHRIDESMFGRAGQEFEEVSLSRTALFAGRTGGLIPLDRLDRFFLTFSAQGFDEFELRSADDRPRTVGMAAAQARLLCKDCHGAPGIYSFNSYLPFRLAGPGAVHPARLFEVSLADSIRTAVEWKERRPDWRALQALLQAAGR